MKSKLTNSERMARQNARAIQKIKQNALAAAKLAARIKAGELTAAQALKELSGKSETERLHDREN